MVTNNSGASGQSSDKPGQQPSHDPAKKALDKLNGGGATDPGAALKAKVEQKLAGKNGLTAGAAKTASAAAAGAAGGTKMSKAVGGGVQGAALEGARTVFTKGNRKTLLLLFLPFLAPAMAFGMVMVLAMILGAGVTQGSGANAIRDSITTAKKDGLTQEEYASFVDAQSRTGVPWQILAALYKQQTSTQTGGATQCDPNVQLATASSTSTPGSPSSSPPPTGETNDASNPKYVHPSTKSPVIITSGWGPRNLTNMPWASKYHQGIDVGIPVGTPMVAVGEGTVVYTGAPGGTAGNVVVLRLPDGSEVRYLHLSEILVSKGQKVSVKTIVAKSGTAPGGAHLHFETSVGIPMDSPVDWMYRTHRSMDPILWLRAHGVDPYTGTSGGLITTTPNDCIPTAAQATTIASPSASPSSNPSGTASPSPTTDEHGTDHDEGDTYISARRIPEAKLTAAQKAEFAKNENAATMYVARTLRDTMKSDPKLSSRMAMSTGLRREQGTGKRYISTESTEAREVATSWATGMNRLELGGLTEGSASEVYETALAWYLGKSASPGGGASGMVCAPPAGQTFTVRSATRPSDAVVMDQKRMGYAATIYGIAKSAGVTPNGILSTFMTALQESRLSMHANSKVPPSMSLPHDKVGTDGTSVGLFQQQVGTDGSGTYGWGNYQQAMDVSKSTLSFLGKLPGQTAQGMTVRVPDYETRPPGVVAQTVQQSAHADLYDQWEQAAKTIVASMSGAVCTAGSGDSSAIDVGNYKIPAGGCSSCVAEALKVVGTPYSYGGGDITGPTRGIFADGIDSRNVIGFDCARLMRYSWHKGAGMQLPYTASPQMQLVRDRGTGLTMNYKSLKPGALLFFRPRGPEYVGHVGMYMGNDLMVHAPNPSTTVKVVNLTQYIAYNKNFVGGGMPPGFTAQAAA